MPFSGRIYSKDGGSSSVGRVPDCDSGCRGFEPRLPPHFFGGTVAKRVVLFLITNAAILVLLSITMRLFGVTGYLDSSGSNLDFRGLLLFAVVIGFGGSFISLAMSKWSAKFATGAKVIVEPTTKQQEWLVKTLEVQARSAGIGKPELAIYQSSQINAFATGMSRNNSLVAFSSGLLEAMTDDEIEAVMAHEISHIANGDMITLTLIQGVINTFVFILARVIGHFVDRVILKNNRGHGIGFWVATILAEIILAVLASIIVLWFSRQREFKADAGAAWLVGKNKMISALEKLQSNYEPSQLPDQIKALGVSGSSHRGILELFSSHPPLSHRISALKNLS